LELGFVINASSSQGLGEMKHSTPPKAEIEDLRTSLQRISAAVTFLKTDSSRLTEENKKMEIGRDAFDNYETLKDSARSIQRRYFSLKRGLGRSTQDVERRLEKKLDEIQEEYTKIALELDRLPHTKAQELLRRKGKEINQMLKEMGKNFGEMKRVLEERIKRENDLFNKECELMDLMRKRSFEEGDMIGKLGDLMKERLKAARMKEMIENRIKKGNS
jgi:hypothetical protein